MPARSRTTPTAHEVPLDDGGSLFAECWGDPGAPAVLYLHGGPGQGAYEFGRHQGELLSRDLFVVALDQRGVLRSSALPADELLCLDDLVADCERVRRHLGLERWGLIGQSFGGMLATRYAVECPDVVTAVVFENPSWDIARTARSVLGRVVGPLEEYGEHTLAAKASAAVIAELSASELWSTLVEALGGLGEHREELYLPDPEAHARVHRILAAAPFTSEQWSRGGAQAAKITADPAFYEDHTAWLGRMSQPALLVKGGLDPIPSPSEVDDFRRVFGDAAVRVVEGVGHFVQAERPEDYVRVVTELVTGRPAPTAGQLHQRRDVAESFGTDAARYDRSRPSYPPALVDRIITTSPGPDVLDVGIGTGIVARLLRDAGCRVVGVDADQRMAEFARGDGFEVEVAKFEDWDAGGRLFDAVVAGQTWHWIEPVAGAARAASLLRPGGLLALFWNADLPPADLTAAFGEIYLRVAPHSLVARRWVGGRPTLTLDSISGLAQGPAEAVRESGAFSVPEEWRFDWERRYTKEEWLDQVPSTGDHSKLPRPQLDELLAGIGEAIDAAGGDFVMPYTTVAVAALRR